MAYPMLCPRGARMLAPLLLLFAASASTGCGDPLEVDDPTTILEKDVSDAQGAELLRRGVLASFAGMVDGAAWESGLVADEFRYDAPAGTVAAYVLLDRRAGEEYQESFSSGAYYGWQSLRARETTVTLAKLRAYAVPGAREAHVGEMFAVRGYAALRLAEDFCPGFPLHQVKDFKVVYGPSRSTAEVLESALADFDSAVSWAADSARVLNFARVGRARALLNLGRFAEAAAAVADVPTPYTYVAEYNSTFTPYKPNELSALQDFGWGTEKTVADREGGMGLDFVSADDPRVPTDSLGMALDGTTVLYGVGKYPSIGTPIVVAGGIEARLIAAEAALRADPDNPQWLVILNELRQTQVSPALPDTTDPGTAAGREDLLFRERAFWLFATGSRLADLRRLIRQYGRDSESIFPAGPYWRSGAYGTGTSIPFDRREAQFGPGVTECTSW